jgi:hypothetical protein
VLWAHLRQGPGDLPVRVALLEELHDQPLHLLGSGEVAERADRGGNLEGRIVPRGGMALVVLSALFGWLPVLGGGRYSWGSA